jgi:hypothetical protein
MLILLDRKKKQSRSDAVTKTLHVIFDGKVLRPDGPVDSINVSSRPYQDKQFARIWKRTQ